MGKILVRQHSELVWDSYTMEEVPQNSSASAGCSRQMRLLIGLFSQTQVKLGSWFNRITKQNWKLTDYPDQNIAIGDLYPVPGHISQFLRLLN